MRECICRLQGEPALAADALRRALPGEPHGEWEPVDLLFILAFVALLGFAVFALFLPRSGGPTFTAREWEAFDHAEQVKKDLAAVQTKVNPPKPPFQLTLTGANVPKPPDPP